MRCWGTLSSQCSGLACVAVIPPGSSPASSKKHKTKGTLSGQIIDRITKELGIRVTPHQFRHLAAAFILEKDPANYEFVRRVLGHKNLQTTINFYVGLETVEAVRKFSAMALEDVAWRPAPMTEHRRHPPCQKALPLADWSKDRSRSLARRARNGRCSRRRWRG